MKSWICSGKQLVDGGLPLRRVVGQDDVLDQLTAVAEEHVLGAAQPDALGAELACARGVLGVVGVGADSEPSGRVGVPEQAVDGAHQVGGRLVGVLEGLVETVLEVGGHR